MDRDEPVKALSWGAAAGTQPDLFDHCAHRLGSGICYLSTVRADEWPRLHPIGPLKPQDGRILVGMLPSSPKGHDLRRNGRYAVHCTVEDGYGGGGEVLMTGLAEAREPPYSHAERGWVTFELLVGELLATIYDREIGKPLSRRWRAEQPWS